MSVKINISRIQNSLNDSRKTWIDITTEPKLSNTRETSAHRIVVGALARVPT